MMVPNQMSPFNIMVTQLKVESLLDWVHIVVLDQISSFNRMITQL